MSDIVSRVIDRHLGRTAHFVDGKPMCDGEKNCQEPPAFLDREGYIYCEKHGKRLKSAGRPGVRALRPAEIKKLNEGKTLRYAAADQDEAPPPDEDEWKHWEKRGEWNLNVYQQRSRWGYFMKNPKGGGGGSGSYPSMKAAIAAGMRVGWSNPRINPDGKDKVWLTILKWDPNKNDWAAAKSSWVDVPDHLKQPVRPLSDAEKWEMHTR